MSNTLQIAQQLIKQPIALYYTNEMSSGRKLAGLILLSFFLLLGIGIFKGGLEAEENGVYYMVFGVVLGAFPFFLLFLMINNKKKSIALIDKEGVTLKNNKKYNWENLRSITYHTSLYEKMESERYISIEFIFADNSAFVFYDTDQFSNIVYIAERLQVPIKETAVARFK
ncbi:MAG: hypothetical protein IPM95_10610 [Sphingobacteriales bacterium]|nr:hypothetical protein [Sphingobacteriales bacterium]